MEEAMGEIRVRVLLGGGDAVDLGDVARRKFFDTVHVSAWLVRMAITTHSAKGIVVASSSAWSILPSCVST